jgi:subtilisin-like proprotein convertase family protein
VGETVNLAITASDPNGDPLSFSAIGVPDGITFSVITGAFTGFPTQAGNYTVTVTVSDGIDTVQMTFDWLVVGGGGGGGCTVYPSADVPQLIDSSGTPSISSTLSVTQAGPVIDVNVVNLQGTHTYMSDLSFTLQSSAGSSVQVIAPSCGSQNNFDLNLDDAALANFPCPPVGGGTYQPSNALSAFNGEEASGTWTMTIQDGADQDGGNLDSWGLEVCVSGTGTNTPPVLANPGNQSHLVGSAVTLNLSATDADGDTMTYAESGLPAGLSLDTASGAITGSPTTANSYPVTVSVSDGTVIVQQNFTWTVTDSPAGADGDLNSDGTVNAADVLIATQILTSQRTITPEQMGHGDVAPLVAGQPAPDGQFNVGDLVVIQRKALGLISY